MSRQRDIGRENDADTLPGNHQRNHVEKLAQNIEIKGFHWPSRFNKQFAELSRN